MFFVRSKARALKMRDPETGKMLDVGPSQWVRFGTLPRGTTEQGGCDVEVRTVKTQEDLAAIEAENKLAAEDDSRRSARRSSPQAVPPTDGDPPGLLEQTQPPTDGDQYRKRKGHR
jgi:hypothetical protein